MYYITSIERDSVIRGRMKERSSLISSQLTTLFGDLPPDLRKNVKTLSPKAQLELSALLKFRAPEDLRHWLQSRPPVEPKKQRPAPKPFITSLERLGIKLGRKEARCEVILMVLAKRFGALPTDIVKRIQRLSLKRQGLLLATLLDFKSLDEVRQWLPK